MYINNGSGPRSAPVIVMKHMSHYFPMKLLTNEKIT